MDHLMRAMSMEWANAVGSVRVMQRKLKRFIELGDLTEEQVQQVTRQQGYRLEDLIENKENP